MAFRLAIPDRKTFFRMLAVCKIAPADSDHPPSNLKPKASPELLSQGRKNFSFSRIQPYLSFKPHIQPSGIWILFITLLLQLFLLFCARSMHFFTPSLPGQNPIIAISPVVINGTAAEVLCPLGKVYVYDLPPFFNSDLIRNCHQLNPWRSRCDAVSNGGFGKTADGISKFVPENLKHAWYWTDQFALELIHHNRMMKYRCRSLEPESAAAFYLPFYVGLAVGKYLWPNNTNEDRDRHCQLLLNWVENQPYWNRSHGRDHFMTVGRITWDFRRTKDYHWGSSCIYMPGMQNITRLVIERHPWDPFDIAVPYPTGFHPSSVAEMTAWQNFVLTRQRRTLYSFVGGRRGLKDFRGLLLSQCYNNSDACRVVDCTGKYKCSDGNWKILEAFLDSDFCLQPRGDSHTRRSTFDCMVAGSIPVFFWRRTAYVQYTWFLPDKPESYSVFIHRSEVQNGTTSIRSVLENISRERIKMMREKVVEYIPKLVYSKPSEGLEGMKDAFDVAVDGILKRVQTLEKVVEERKSMEVYYDPLSGFE